MQELATLFAAAEQHGVDLYYEASVAGAIPLLRPLRESLAGDKVRRVLGIVTLLLIITAVILGLVGRKQLERVKGLEASPASIEKTKAVLSRKPIPTAPSTTATTTAPGTA